MFCKICNETTFKSNITREGFKIRTWECPKCGKIWHHPLDTNDYLQFNKLRNKEFKIKLRKVGNSYTATIPNEIIEFEGVKKPGRILNLRLEKAKKIGIEF